MPQIYEYRGVEGLVYAPVTEDSTDNYSTGTVKELAGVAEISKSTDSTNEAHYYDNLPAVIVSSTGSDEITISASAIPLDVLAEITGQQYDSATGMFVEMERMPRYFAIGYKTKDTNGNDYYVWRLKGTFNIPDQTNSTINDGTDANGQEITFTGISTIHKFTKTGNKPAKSITVNTGLDLADVSNFFASVQTPDTIQPKTITPSIEVTPSTAFIETSGTIQLAVVTVPDDASVTWTSSDSAVTVNTSGLCTAGEDAGSAVVSASITVDGRTYTDSCAITVSAPQA